MTTSMPRAIQSIFGLGDRHRVSIMLRLLAMLLAAALIQPSPVYVAEKVDVATSALEFGGSIGKLLWVEQTSRTASSMADADRYTKLANQVKEQIDLGRASSSLVAANFNVIATTLTYAAIVDPEPLSKAVAAIAAWGAKKTGDAIGEMVIQKSQDQAKEILAAGLRNAGLSPAELQAMTPDQLRDKVADLQIGDQKMRDILHDDPKTLSMLQANAVDLATNIGVEEIARSTATAKSANSIRSELVATRQEIQSYQDEVTSHLQAITDRMSDLETATEDASSKLSTLQVQVQGNSKVMQTLAAVSYSGWSPAQKLQAVQGGLFPGLDDSQKSALVASLQADIARQKAVDAVTQAASDLGNLASIAHNIGLPGNVVTGLKGAQILATGVAQFATGNYLGAVASVTSLVGLGAPDASAQQYAAMMQYLQQQFAIVNEKLNRIIDLQVQTIKAISALAEQQRDFSRKVFGQLDRIENTVLTNNQILEAIVLNQWNECRDLINGPLNGQFEIGSRDTLLRIVRWPNINNYAGGCYAMMVGFLDDYVKSANWSGQIISAAHFPTATIANTPDLQRGWLEYQKQQSYAYRAASDFILAKIPEAKHSPAIYLARFAQPVINASYQDSLGSVLSKVDVQSRFASFNCNQPDVLSVALHDLICFGTIPGQAVSPIEHRWEDLLNSALIGPQSQGLIDTV